MKVKGLVLTLLILMISISVFAAGTEDFKMNINENIPIEKWVSKKTNVSVPGGIVFLDDYIYVTDSAEGKIVVLDKNGDFQRQSSKDDALLIEPTTIKTDGELLYVFDSGDKLLKVLTKEFKLVKSRDFPDRFSNVKYWDLEVINDVFYLSAFSMLEEEAIFYQYNENDGGGQYIAADGFLGYLANFNGELMAVNSLDFAGFKTEDGVFPVKSFMSGKNSLFKVRDLRVAEPFDELKEVFKFTDKYIPLDFLLLDGYIYVFSAANEGVDKYTTAGEYVETVLTLADPGLFVQMTAYGDTILVAIPSKKSIYEIDLDEKKLTLEATYYKTEPDEKEQIFEVNFIEDYMSFLLKNGREVVVIDMLSFNVGSDSCRGEINLRKNAIISSLQDLFIQKKPSEISTPAGLELLNREIRDIVNRATGFIGENGQYGVLEVFYHITALTSVQ